MTHEHDIQTPESETLSKSEKKLNELRKNIWEAYTYLMDTFFQDETWSVRQGGAYGFAFLEVEGDGKNHDWDKETQIVNEIIEKLGDRLGYIEAAYHFPDNLSALGQMCSPWWTEMMAKRKPEKSKAKIAREVYQKLQRKLKTRTKEFETFLKSEFFKNAFRIVVDKKTGEYQIHDLQHDAKELWARWQEWFGVESNERRTNQ